MAMAGWAKGAGVAKKQDKKAKAGKQRKGGGFAPALCNLLGTLLLLAVIALCVPIAVPPFMGYQVYEVVSGSMEPEIPMGSVVFVEPAEPAGIGEGEVIAFQEGDSIIVHRVVINRTTGEFVTKGDANNVEDLNPVPYDAVIGRVSTHVPQLGAFMAIYASNVGKIYLLMAAACGVMFNMLASRMRRTRKAAAEAQQKAALQAQAEIERLAGAGAATVTAGGDFAQATPKRRGGALRRVAIAVLAVVFLGSAGVVGYANYQYGKSDALYAGASDRFTAQVAESGPVAPITVDFAALQAENPDVVGWIYCEGTPINYPLLYGRDNDQYLHHDYTGAYNIDGSIFVDADNSPGFADSNTIIYGHHMNSGSMFACLEKWTDQAFYDEHPVVWILTPERDYQVQLFSGRHLSARSDAYDIIATPGKKLDALLATALMESSFDADAELICDSNGDPIVPAILEETAAGMMIADDEEAAEAEAAATADGEAAVEGEAADAAEEANAAATAEAAADDAADAAAIAAQESTAAIKLDPRTDRYVMLTTCAYVFDNARYVLHGKLVPAASAGGVPLEQ